MKLPYELNEVRTPEQARQFFDLVIVPAADILAGGSYSQCSDYELTRDQTRQAHDAIGTWSTIGFKVTKLMPEEDLSDVLYNFWSYQAYDTGQFPFSADAQEKADELAQQKVVGEKAVEKELGRPLQPGEFEYSDEVVDTTDFYIGAQALQPVRDTDILYTRNGVTVWTESQTSEFDESVSPPDGQSELLDEKVDDACRTFNTIDLELITTILHRLGLLATN